MKRGRSELVRLRPSRRGVLGLLAATSAAVALDARIGVARSDALTTVSYTHLTLPTILRV